MGAWSRPPCALTLRTEGRWGDLTDRDASSQEPLFAARVIYDLLFFFMVIIIVLNLIFGVIIDTFADLRSEKQKKEEILKTTCFICGECPARLRRPPWALGGLSPASVLLGSN